MIGAPRAATICVLANLFAIGAASAVEPPPATGLPSAPVATAPGVAPEISPIAPAAPVDVDLMRDANRVQSSEIQQFVNDAKERDFVTKMKLHTFNEEVLKHIEPPGGARLIITARNEMGGGFQLIGLAYALDGSPAYAKLDPTGGLDERGQIAILDTKVIPGDHQLVVQYDVRGTPLGLLSYMETMKIVLRRSYNFKVEKGKETRLIGTLATDDNVTMLYENRPMVGFQTLAIEVADKAAAANAKAADGTEEKSKEGTDAPPPPDGAAQPPAAPGSDAAAPATTPAPKSATGGGS